MPARSESIEWIKFLATVLSTVAPVLAAITAFQNLQKIERYRPVSRPLLLPDQAAAEVVVAE
jgi:hypothetical protein